MLTWVLLTNGDPVTLVPIAQRHVREIDANVPLFEVRTMEEVAARSVERRRWMMTLLSAFAVLALLMAAAGIYGVMAHLVSLRTAEIGVRLTLGASPASVMRQILGEGAMQAAIGLVIGLVGSLAVMRGLRTILFGIEPTDPITLVAVGVSLMAVALLAVAVPALRAMRVDPVTALRRVELGSTVPRFHGSTGFVLPRFQSFALRRTVGTALRTKPWNRGTPGTPWNLIISRPRRRRMAGDRRRLRACCPSG